MQCISAARWSQRAHQIPVFPARSCLNFQFSFRGDVATAAKCAKQPYACWPAQQQGIRLFGSLKPSNLSNGTGDSCFKQQLPPWEEVEAQRPLAPDPYDGTYQMPRGAPDPRNLSRQQFHQFMHGKPQRFSKELKVAVMGFSLTAVGVGVTWLTAYIMRPDDFEWVEEERKRIQDAKERIQRKIDQANKSQGGDNQQTLSSN